MKPSKVLIEAALHYLNNHDNDWMFNYYDSEIQDLRIEDQATEIEWECLESMGLSEDEIQSSLYNTFNKEYIPITNATINEHLVEFIQSSPKIWPRIIEFYKKAIRSKVDLLVQIQNNKAFREALQDGFTYLDYLK